MMDRLDAQTHTPRKDVSMLEGKLLSESPTLITLGSSPRTLSELEIK
jgi:hypothetical protein